MPGFLLEGRRLGLDFVIYQLYDPKEVILTSVIHSFIIWLSEYVLNSCNAVHWAKYQDDNETSFLLLSISETQLLPVILDICVRPYAFYINYDSKFSQYSKELLSPFFR